MKSIRILISLLPALALFACGSRADEPEQGKVEDKPAAEVGARVEIKLTDRQKSLLDSQAQFNCNFFKVINATENKQNFIMSPLSMSVDFAILANGAAGNTYTALAKMLGCEGVTIDELNGLNRLLLTNLPSVDKNTSLALANSVWADNGFPLLSGYTKACEDNFDATVKNVTMGTEQARVAINEWADTKTNGIIKEFLTTAPQGCMLLTNAMYFKSVWTKKFSASDTKKKVFHGTDKDVTVDFMENEKALASNKFIEGFGAVVTLPFSNQNFNFSIVLPVADIDAAISALTPQALNNILEVVKTAPLDEMWISLPKFKLASSYANLIDACKSIGFPSESDYSKMTTVPLEVNLIKQKVVFEIDEEGGQGAAVSGIGMITMAGPNVKPVCLTIDRPFFFLISERSTGAVLFMGKVSQL